MRKALLAMAMLALLGTTAWAGKTEAFETTVNTSSRWATGLLGYARNSTDSNQYIGCYVLTRSSGYEWAECWANDRNNVYAACGTSNQTIVSALHALTEGSQIYFAWDATGTCTAIQINVDSEYEPKQP